jgi:septal ring factor EnvC (AmiA/AmiB activator)
MRPVIILLGVLTIVLAVICLQQRRIAHEQLTAAQQQTESTSNALRTAQTELTTFKAQQAVVVNQLQQQVATLTADKAAVEEQHRQAREQAESLKQELADARKAAQEQQDRLSAVEEEKQKLAAESANLAEKLRNAEQELAAREKPPPSAVAQPTPPSESQASPEPTARPVKKRHRIVEAVAPGNRGILFHDGRWHTVLPAAQPAVAP